MGKVYNGKYQIDISLFENVSQPEIAYFLGFFWADGHLYKNKNNLSCRLKFLYEDFLVLQPTLCKFLNWTISTRTPPNRRRVVDMYFGGNQLGQFLQRFGYLTKSGGDPVKIINHIPETLRKYWFRGYFDGDGHINKTQYSIEFASAFDQNWDFLIDLCSRCGIEDCSIVKQHLVKNNHRRSYLLVRGLEYANRMLHFLYGDYDINKIGLTRKANLISKYQLAYKTQIEQKTSTYQGVEFNKASEKWRCHVFVNKKNKCLGSFDTEEQAVNRLRDFHGPDKTIKQFPSLDSIINGAVRETGVKVNVKRFTHSC